jgi:hypothetical protein
MARRRGALGFGSILGLDLMNPRSWERSQIGRTVRRDGRFLPRIARPFCVSFLISEAVEVGLTMLKGFQKLWKGFGSCGRTKRSHSFFFSRENKFKH